MVGFISAILFLFFNVSFFFLLSSFSTCFFISSEYFLMQQYNSFNDLLVYFYNGSSRAYHIHLNLSVYLDLFQ